MRYGRTPRSAGDSVVDIGEVPPEVAVDFFLGLAQSARESVAEDAILPAILARDVVVWPRVLEIARDDDRPEDVRESSVFWLAQRDDPEVLDFFEEILLGD